LTSSQYTVLQDVKHAFPPYQACFVVRDDVLDKTPGLRNALAALSGTIDDATMRQMNRQVDINHIPVVRVAADFLSNLDKRRRQASQASL
jgi:osmoprotectant transport system substrate-binding protein